MTVRAFVELWLESSVKGSVSEATHFRYCVAMQSHVYKTIGNLPIQKLRPAHVQKLLGGMVNQRRKPKENEEALTSSGNTKSHVLVMLKKAMASAVALRVIHSNPCDPVDRPTWVTKEMHPLNLEESQEFREQSEKLKNDFHVFFMVALFGGLRSGEIRALRIPDINFEAKGIAITRTISTVGTKDIEKNCKTAKSRRFVNLPDWLIADLKQIVKRRLKSEEGSRALLFPGERTKYISRSRVLWQFRRALKLAGLPRIRVHDLRHTHATLLLLSGVHPKVVQERLGHATIAMTLDLYSHVLPSMQAVAVEKLDELFPNKPIGNKKGNMTIKINQKPRKKRRLA